MPRAVLAIVEQQEGFSAGKAPSAQATTNAGPQRMSEEMCSLSHGRLPTLVGKFWCCLSQLTELLQSDSKLYQQSLLTSSSSRHFVAH